MPQNLVIAGLPNHAAAAVASVTLIGGGAGPAGMPIANVKTQEPWQVGRVPSIFPHESGIEVDFGATPATLQTLALVNDSMIPGDQLRVVGVESGALPPARSETIAPDTIEASEGTGGSVVGDIDEHPSAPDAAYAGPAVDGGDWMVQLSFPAASDTLATGDTYQAFVLWVKLSGEPQGPEDFATVKASIFNIVTQAEVRDLGTKVFNAAGGSLLIFPWDAADGPPDANPNVLRLDIGGGLFPLGTGRGGQLGAVAWEVMHASDVAAADFGTGWITRSGAEIEAAWGNTALQEVDLPPPLWARILDVPASFSKLRVEFRADGLGKFDSFLTTPPRTPNGFIDVGVLVAGPAFEVSYNFAPGGTLTSRPQLIGDEDGLTGSNRAVAAYRKRAAEVEFALLPEATAHSLFARLDHAAMGVAAFLVILEPWSLDPVTGNPTIARNTTFWAIAEEARGLIYSEGFEDDGEPLRSMGYRIVEKL